MGSKTLTLGPVGDQWQYAPSTKSYDLTRGSSKKLSIGTNRGTEVDSISIDPEISALIIVDMQNFFLHPKCRDHPLGLKTIDPLLKVIDTCRIEGIQIVWLNWGLTEHDLVTMPAVTQRSFPRSLVPGASIPPGYGRDLGDGKGRVLMAETWNADIYEPLKPYVHREDVLCNKNRLSGMWAEDQPLRKYLKESGKKTLLFAGVNTDRCVLGTLADAAYAGWDCALIEDCCATVTKEAHDSCVTSVELLHGFVVSCETFVAAASHK